MNAPVAIKHITQKKAQVEKNYQNSCLMAISEIFGPTIQGEGALIGTPTVFVRTGGCDYRCRWCDTGYAVLPKYENQWQWMDATDVFTEIERLSNGHPLWVTLSGGNPALQDLEKLILMGQKKGYLFSMETQGSIAKPWFSLLDQLTLSPKPPSSGMRFKKRGLERCLQACQAENPHKHTPELSLKFVVADEQDLQWAKSIADQYPHIPCFVQPCNTQATLDGSLPSVKNPAPDCQHPETNTHSQSQLLDLIAATQALNWYEVRILPQLHTWLWGDQTGV